MHTIEQRRPSSLLHTPHGGFCGALYQLGFQVGWINLNQNVLFGLVRIENLFRKRSQHIYVALHRLGLLAEIQNLVNVYD